jgi:flagellar motor switch protein FliN
MADTEQAVVEQTPDVPAGEVQNVELEQVTEGMVPATEENLDILLDIHMPITVNMGRTVVPFRQLLQMGPGSVLQLDKAVGQPAEIFVQDIRFATGDIVVVDGCYAVRIKDILSREEIEAQAEEAQG